LLNPCSPPPEQLSRPATTQARARAPTRPSAQPEAGWCGLCALFRAGERGERGARGRHLALEHRVVPERGARGAHDALLELLVAQRVEGLLLGEHRRPIRVLGLLGGEDAGLRLLERPHLLVLLGLALRALLQLAVGLLLLVPLQPCTRPARRQPRRAARGEGACRAAGCGPSAMRFFSLRMYS